MFRIVFIFTISIKLIYDQGKQKRISLVSFIEFTKQDSADWILPENQDRISSSIWITRKHNQSIFNIAREDGYSVSNSSPLGTLWSNAPTVNTQSSDYTSFVAMHEGNPQCIINDTVSLYIPDYERYFDLIFLSFSGGNSSGGFS